MTATRTDPTVSLSDHDKSNKPTFPFVHSSPTYTRTDPTVSLLDHDKSNKPTFPYVHSSQTDIRQTFARVRARTEQHWAPTNVKPIKRGGSS